MDTYTILLRFNQSANRGAVGLALLSIIVFAIVLGAGLTVGPVNV